MVQEGTTGTQRVVRGRLDTIAADAAAANLRAPAIVVVGEVVDVLPHLP